MTSCCGKFPIAHPEATAAHVDAIAKVTPADKARMRSLRERLVAVPGGIFDMGARRSTYPVDLDSPRRKIRVADFLMAPTAVTNREFTLFVESTGYRTVAERAGWSYVFHLLLADRDRWRDHPPGLPWWRAVPGACWSAPEGDGSDLSERQDHPVVQVAWFDAVAYCLWSGTRLPNEAEWERAARGGLARRKFPWGQAMMPSGAHMMNTWQGDFPHVNTAADGYASTAPVDAFEPNGYGMYNMTGNVWEWVADRTGPLPHGLVPVLAHSLDADGSPRIQRGGSFLCHESYCDRYHVHSRTANDPDSSTSNAGFRVAG